MIFFFNTWTYSESMQREEMEGDDAQNCEGAAGNQTSQDPTDVHTAAHKLMEQVRLFTEQYEVIFGVVLWFAHVRLTQMCACRTTQEKVRVLTAENAALRLQIAQQEQTLQSDAREQVSCVCLLYTQMQLFCFIHVLHHVSWNLYLRIYSCCRNDHGTVHVTACATQQRPKQPAAFMLYHVRLCNALSLHVRHPCALLLDAPTDVYNA
jgi:hypothetical protein